MKRFFLFIVLFTSLLSSCKEKEKEEISTSQSTSTILTPGKDTDSKRTDNIQIEKEDSSISKISNKDSIELLQLSREILEQIKTKNYPAIAKYIDPVLGIRFSPYAYVDTLKNVVLLREKFLTQASSLQQDTILWGEMDGSGKAIRLTLDQYMQPEKASVDKFLGGGNSLNNLLQVYKDCHFTESYFSGFEKKYEGMDWRTLRLVFKERDKKFYLIGIVHDQWTI
jgi:hypothetical protein